MDSRMNQRHAEVRRASLVQHAEHARVARQRRAEVHPRKSLWLWFGSALKRTAPPEPTAPVQPAITPSINARVVATSSDGAGRQQLT